MAAPQPRWRLQNPHGRHLRHREGLEAAPPSLAPATTSSRRTPNAKYEMRTHMALMFLTTKAMVEKRLEAKDQKIQRSRGMNWVLCECLRTSTSTPVTMGRPHRFHSLFGSAC